MSNYYMSDHTPVGGSGVSPKGNGYSHCQSTWRRVNTGSGDEGLTSSPKNEVRKAFSSLCVSRNWFDQDCGAGSFLELSQ